MVITNQIRLKELHGQFKNTGFTGNKHPEPDVVGYGDIHLSYMYGLFSSHRILFNTGSVGCPCDEPRAAYVMLERYLDSPEIKPFSANAVKVSYDVELAVKQAEAVAVPGLLCDIRKKYLFRMR